MADTQTSSGAAGGEVDEAQIEAMFAAKKKKKKAKKGDEDGTGAEGDASAAGSGASAGAAPGHLSTVGTGLAALADGETHDTYDEMLSRVFHLLHENNPELIGRERRKLKPPQVSRVGTTRTAWTNFSDICSGMKRGTDHVLSFFLAELGTTGSVDGSERLVMRGKYQPKYIESLLRKYITEFVLCQMCRSMETELARDQMSRLYFMTCKACGSTRSVAPIKAGYHATGKGERRKAREALG